MTAPLTDVQVELMLTGRLAPSSEDDWEVVALIEALRTSGAAHPAPTPELRRVLTGFAPAPAPSPRRRLRAASWFAGLGLAAQVTVGAAGAAAALGVAGAAGALPGPAQHAVRGALHWLGVTDGTPESHGTDDTALAGPAQGVVPEHVDLGPPANGGHEPGDDHGAVDPLSPAGHQLPGDIAGHGSSTPHANGPAGGPGTAAHGAPGAATDTGDGQTGTGSTGTDDDVADDDHATAGGQHGTDGHGADSGQDGDEGPGSGSGSSDGGSDQGGDAGDGSTTGNGSDTSGDGGSGSDGSGSGGGQDSGSDSGSGSGQDGGSGTGTDGGGTGTED